MTPKRTRRAPSATQGCTRCDASATPDTAAPIVLIAHVPAPLSDPLTDPGPGPNAPRPAGAGSSTARRRRWDPPFGRRGRMPTRRTPAGGGALGLGAPPRSRSAAGLAPDGRPGRGEGAELLQEAEEVGAPPPFGDAAIGQAEDGDAREGHPLAGGRYARERPRVGPRQRVAGRDQVVLGHHLMEGGLDVGEGLPEGAEAGRAGVAAP